MKKLSWVWMIALLCFSAWATIALFLDVRTRLLGTVLSALFTIAALVFSLRRRQYRCLILWTVLDFLVLAWWLSLRPTNDRLWQTDVSVLPWAEIDGNRALVHAVRDFSYRTENDYIPHWETKSVDLARIQGLDLFLTHWGVPLVAHTIVSFQCGDGTWLATSIEERQAVGQKFSAFKGFFRQYNLIYLIAEERDLIRLRTNYRDGEEVYLYHTLATPADARRLFLAYLSWMNRARIEPQWYNALTANCGTPFVRYLAHAGIGGVSRWDPRGILDGDSDRMLYDLHDLAGSLPFPELKRQAWINPVARTASPSDFSRKIREGHTGFASP
jgi:hypothetical protein